MQDLLVIGYLTVLCVAVGSAPDSPDKTRYLLEMLGLFVYCATAVLLVRGEVIRGCWAGVIYRLGVYGSVQLSYFSLRGLLPLVNAGSLDAELHALDVRLFGVEPTLYLEQFVTPARTEWFAFFYFSYFLVLGVSIFGMLIFERSQRRLGEFAFALSFVYCVGQVVYMLVPGYGPISALAGDFEHPLPKGFWHDVVMGSVATAGAQKDIFPSLHTAAPSVVTLFAWRYRQVPAFRFALPVLAFATVNIIIATVFLRWHWTVDLVAGLVLAVGAHFLARAVVRRELSSRAARGFTPPWPELWGR